MTYMEAKMFGDDTVATSISSSRYRHPAEHREPGRTVANYTRYVRR